MSWEQLRAIHQQNCDAYQAEQAEPPVTCPNDSTLLLKGPNGELHCNFDGWTWANGIGRIRE